ncbi:RNA polymerase sigma factor [Streptomyces sp. NPDC016640]|uniref:RNA polymerase sigma factor n=1 Tax=Streptomyces sp. NPDC016640 TaxID=3364969 RepID=UPI003701D5C6
MDSTTRTGSGRAEPSHGRARAAGRGLGPAGCRLRRRRSGTGAAVRTLVAVDFLLHERARPGDRTAFAEIFDEHARVVYAHAIRTTGDWALAEDVMSLTFLEAWRLRDKLREEVGSVPGVAFGHRGRRDAQHRPRPGRPRVLRRRRGSRRGLAAGRMWRGSRRCG